MKMSKNYYSELYDKNYFLGKKSFFYKFGYKDSIKVWKSRLDIILKYKKKGKLLDVGCAFGYMLIPLSKYFRVYGFDCSEYAVNIAKKNVKEGVFKVHNAEESFPFRSNFFDVVTCFDVIEHLRNNDRLIENIFDVLKERGILFLTTPNYNLPRKLLYHFPDKMEYHISLYHINEVINLLKKHNFEIINYFTGINFFNKSVWFKTKFGLETLVISKKV